MSRSFIVFRCKKVKNELNGKSVIFRRIESPVWVALNRKIGESTKRNPLLVWKLSIKKICKWCASLKENQEVVALQL